MVERNEKGRQARRYFIECERQLRQALAPSDSHAALAVKYMQLELDRSTAEIERLAAENQQLANKTRILLATDVLRDEILAKDWEQWRDYGYRQAMNEMRKPARLVGRFDGLHAAHAIRAVLLEGIGNARVTQIIKALESAGYGLGIYPLRTVSVTVTSSYCVEMFSVTKHRNGDHAVSLKLVANSKRLGSGKLPADLNHSLKEAAAS